MHKVTLWIRKVTDSPRKVTHRAGERSHPNHARPSVNYILFLLFHVVDRFGDSEHRRVSLPFLCQLRRAAFPRRGAATIKAGEKIGRG